MFRKPAILLLAFVLCLLTVSCRQEKKPDPSSLRGIPLEELQQMRQDILDQAGDKPLSADETAQVEWIRAQERRLENAWVFGEWRERHGARLIFRDDGTVSVGARSGAYDELGVYKYFESEEPSYETTWELLYDTAGDPVVWIEQPSGERLIYPFHRSRNEVYERAGDLQASNETGCYFKKIL